MLGNSTDLFYSCSRIYIYGGQPELSCQSTPLKKTDCMAPPNADLAAFMVNSTAGNFCYGWNSTVRLFVSSLTTLIYRSKRISMQISKRSPSMPTVTAAKDARKPQTLIFVSASTMMLLLVSPRPTRARIWTQRIIVLPSRLPAPMSALDSETTQIRYV